MAQGLGVDAIRDLKLLSIRLNDAARKQEHLQNDKSASKALLRGGIPGSDVTLSTSSSEDSTTDDGKKVKNQSVSHKLVTILNSIDLESLWDELTACLRVVSVLEGVADEKDEQKKKMSDNNALPISQVILVMINLKWKKLKNSISGHLSRYLPTI